MAGMDKSRSNWLAPVLVAAILLALAVAYVVAYFATGIVLYSEPGGPVTARIYSSKWHVMVFTPAATVESAVSGNDVDAECIEISYPR